MACYWWRVASILCNRPWKLIISECDSNTMWWLRSQNQAILKSGWTQFITFDLQPLMMLVEPKEDGSVTSLWVAPRQLPAKAQLRRASPWTRYGAPNLANHLLLHIPTFLSATWQFFYWFKHLLNPTWQNKKTDHLISSHGSEALRDGISMTPNRNEVIELQHLITNGWFHYRRLMSNLTTNIPR